MGCIYFQKNSLFGIGMIIALVDGLTVRQCVYGVVWHLKNNDKPNLQKDTQ
jgi:hypothetical protein